MAETHETIADIAQKIRDAGFDELSDHIMAAHKREVREAVTDCNQFGDAAKLREALEFCADVLDDWGEGTGDMMRAARMAHSALAAPTRNCDVGTAEEQLARFRKFCKKGSRDNFEATAYCAYECPCGNNYDCKLAWLQMPYEEGGDK